MVMYGGQIVEKAEVEDLFYKPRMPYTWGLLYSIPRLDEGSRRRLKPIPGAPPLMSNPPPGCRFAPRCTFQIEGCNASVPELLPVGDAGELHEARCLRSVEPDFHTNAPVPAVYETSAPT